MSAEAELHRLLQRQLRRLGLTAQDGPPSASQWQALLATVSRSYTSAEEDRYLLERSLDLSSREMQALYENLRQASETRLAGERDRLASVLAALSDGLCVLDPRGVVQSANASAQALLGADEAALRGKSVLDRFSLHAVADGDAVVAAVVLGFVVGQRQTLRYDRSLLRGAGEARPVACVLTPLIVGGVATGAVFVFRDTTESRQAERELLRTSEALVEARDRALQASRTKSVFLANVSHELRTPLNAILGYSELIQEESQGAATVADAARIHQAAGHLLQLINDILDVSKIEAGKMRLECESFEVPALVDAVASTMATLVQRGGNKLVVDCPAEVGAVVADRTKLGQALLNLLGNAAKFTSQGTIRLVAHREVEPGMSWLGVAARTWVVIAVHDTGIGIPAARLGELFVPFSQVGDSSQRKGGTGLGLTITREYCRMMAGEVSVTSEAGRGSTFTIRVPVDVPAALAAQATL
ncbi:MAG: PAS domain-containing protein [Nannocystis sp.]|uniref:PAS domain-containing sensor histidine kinase n=1 Tax=Nannocystis sp. TaxID=1962667 RepID=UPI002425FB52|nr:ATP-binding protein [Nannocystis sp.]MBK9757835.1 PAS domain-containing protein [Nannocystis sp.]